MSLIKNYLLSLARNAVRDKFFTLLNLLGLAVGITASILIFIYIQDHSPSTGKMSISIEFTGLKAIFTSMRNRT